MEKLLNIIYCVFYKYKMKRKGCKFSRRCKISSDDIFEGNNYISGWVKHCRVGRGTYIMDGCWFQSCMIGRYCSIASEVKMVARRGHPTRNFVSTSPVFHLRNALVNTYVTKDVPPYAVVAGNPARVIRYRFDKEQISKLQKSKWWEWEEARMKEHIELFSSIEDFIKALDA